MQTLEAAHAKGCQGPGYSSAAASSRKLGGTSRTHTPLPAAKCGATPHVPFHQITTVQELEIPAGMLLFLCSRAHRYERNTSYAS